MTLEIVKTTKLVGSLKVGDTVIKTMTADIDDKGVTTFTEWINDSEAYAANRREVRKQEQAFQDAVYAAEDAIIAELEVKGAEKK
ncbi:hypothetical protein [Streptococcus cristatus]|uniref:Phage protein n=1 Tax=Streptococcus cristatus TaxID=45634 RepID=A0A428GKT7_STRCR|nr:hypothetical protein [Streptococcus cristatus]RSJ80024.1 hypothetical protein D8791_08725 [Streptococcus cristatus]